MTVTHPAKFSPTIITAIREQLRELAPSGPLAAVSVLDPFAGVGGIHQLHPEYATFGIELEPEWAAQHDRTEVGDATSLPWPSKSFDVICTSPAYGNRMADSYDGGNDTCTNCDGDGTIEVTTCPAVDDGQTEPCDVCAGTGKKPSTRYTYRIALGRPLSPGSTAGLQWGHGYRKLHLAAWNEAERVLKPGGLFLLNISDHYRDRRLQGVDLWHANALGQLGLNLKRQIPITTPRQGNGANRELRDSCEWLLIFRKPR